MVSARCQHETDLSYGCASGESSVWTVPHVSHLLAANQFFVFGGRVKTRWTAAFFRYSQDKVGREQEDAHCVRGSERCCFVTVQEVAKATAASATRLLNTNPVKVGFTEPTVGNSD